MPLYEYHCDDCQQDFEKIVSFSQADQMPPCPACHGQDTHKKISRVAAFSSGGANSQATSSSACAPRGRFS
jgi:putative FmdB family regulatory protein